MKSKRLLTLLLVVCMVVSMLAPAASAVNAGMHAHETAAAPAEEVNASAEAGSAGHTRKDASYAADAEDAGSDAYNGGWTATRNDNVDSVVLNAETPAFLEELRAAAEVYEMDDVVSAFVVLEDQPLAEIYSSIVDVPSAREEQLETKQNALVERIEADVLDGGELEIEGQFTYLTNSVVVSTEFGNLAEIAELPGVKTVFLTPVYEACTTQESYSPLTVSSGVMSGVPSVWESDYTGAGMTVAILDTGIDMDHPSFKADPALNADSWDMKDVEAKMEGLNALEINPGLTAEDLYCSAKLPYTFNYVTGGTDVNHDPYVGDHGSHVAGIVAANKVEGVNVVGMAPDAQLVIMQVFDAATGGADMVDILNALEDAMTLECDVVNMSLGSPAGFSTTNFEELNAIYERITETDIIVDIAAGNEGTSSYANLWGTNTNPTEHIDNATVSSPSTYANAMSVASVDNAYSISPYFTLGEDVIAYSDAQGLYVLFNSLAGEAVEYVMVPGLGEETDYVDIDVNGKVAVVNRGVITFSKKLAYAEAAGAIGMIVVNNEPGSISSFGMSMLDDDDLLPVDVSGYVPAVLVTQTSGQKLAAAENKSILVSEEEQLIEDEYGGQVSSFSSWGVTPDLRLLPDLAGVGGNVYSCFDGGEYGFMSGTSMATPQVAGVTALVLQYLKEQFPDATQAEMRVLVDSLLMSTAVPVMDKLSGLEASPRHQGAGLVNALNATTADAYLTVAGSERPKAELGDSADGTYSFTFTVHNFSDAEKTYTLSSSLLTEDYTEQGGKEFMAEYEHALDNAAVSFSAESVTVAAGSTADVTVTISLTDADKAWIEEHFANGNYVEGYIYLTAAEGVSLNLPFLGFYGAWDQAPLFDTAYWYNNSFWTDGTTANAVEGSEYFHVVWTSLAGTSWVLGFNPYTGAVQDENGDVIYDPANNIISNNGDGLLDGIEDMYLSLMRNARTLTFTYTDENGNVLHTKTLDFVTKTMYKSSYGQVVPSIYSWYDAEMYDFTDENGDPLPSGTKLTLTVSGQIDYEGSRTHYLNEIPITLDTEYAEIAGEIVESSVDGRNYLTITVKDASLAYAQLMNPTGTQVWGEYTEFVKNEDGTYTLVLDVTDRGNEMMLALCDYGANEIFYELTYSGENMPELDESKLYGYRIYDAQIYDDSLYGWITLDKETAGVTRLTNDMYEYYAINAAEYAGGYVFAVDTGYNFLVMDPGLWTRHTICNLGINVVDMAFDETTGTMYLSAKTKDADGRTVCELYSIDLTTGELTHLKKYSNAYAMPWAMTFVDGELYAIKYYYAGLFKMDMETYDLVAVTDSTGAAFKPKTSDGKTTTAIYSQSMTYSEADGKIYWPFFKSSGGKVVTELFAIDPVTLEYTTTAFPVTAELVGVISVEDDGYELPVSDEIDRLLLADETIALKEGDVAALTYSILPWNADIEAEVSWSTSDETVATVDSEGNVTAIAEGQAIVTAACGDVTAECIVNVTHVEGALYYYDYYDSNGTYEEWMKTDLATMESTILAPSDVDFIAGDYNGHDGSFYGYTEAGGFYRVDMETLETEQVGSGVMPWDMAYDYSTGLMYALIVSNYGNSSIRSVNMRTGGSEALGTIYGAYIVTLACSTDGTLYGTDVEGGLYRIIPMVDDEGAYFETELILDGFSVVQLIQSMCFDHNSGKLIWAKAEESTLYWIDIDDPEHPFAVSLGDPTESGAFQLVGIHTVPEEVPALPYVPVQSLTVSDMYMQIGKGKEPTAAIYPYNATNQNVTWSIADESIAKIDENGMVVGVSQGETTLTATLVDGENTLTATASVTVMEYVGTIHGFVLNDLATGEGLVWAEIEDSNPGEPAYAAVSDATVYAAEYLDGKVYAYAETASGMEFVTINPETYEVESAVTLDADIPYVCDMTYDYIRGTMYALAGYDQTNTDLYIVDMHSGSLMPYMELDATLLSIAASPDGTIYAMESGTNAKLYTLDVDSRTYAEAFSTGVMSNSIASMTFDFDTGYLCWAAMYEDYDDYGELYSTSSLVMIDVGARKVYDLGNIGAGGSQVSGLFIIAENYPEKLDELQSVTMSSNYEELAVGETLQLQAVTQPAFLEASVSWSSDNEAVATVDQTGLVTAVAPGVASVTVTAEYNGKIRTASCAVIVLDAENRFLSYNVTDHGWTTISRTNPTDDEVFLVEDNTAEGYTAVQSATMVNGVIYGYDSDNKFFKITDRQTYERKYLGECDVAFPEEELRETDTGLFEIRDLAYDAANDRLLAIGTHSAITPAGDSIELLTYSKVYTVDLENGHMTELTQVYRSADQYATNIYAITVADDGTVYVYETFYHYVCSLDLETGMLTNLAPTYSFGAYGGSDCEDMSMDYDPVTCTVYLLMYNQNSGYKYHQMFRYNPRSGSLSNLGRVGERVYNKNTWRYEVDAFATLMIEGEHSHAWTAWNETTLHTCMTNGEETRACMLCGETESRTVYAPGHYFQGVVKEPTCTEQGYTYYVCLDCGETYTSDYVDALGHSYEAEVVEPTCTEGGHTVYTCSVCGDSYTADETAALGHSYEAEVVEPTCTEGGYTVYTCAVCGDSYTDEAVEPLGHSYEAEVVKPTCTEGGYTVYTCTVCGESYTGDYTDPHCAASAYADVDLDAWYHEAIDFVVDNGLMKGLSSTIFDPAGDMTRGQMVTVLYRMAGSPVQEDASPFTDVNPDFYYAEAIAWAYANGIANGVSADKFNPDASVTREQMVTFFARYAAWSGVSVESDGDLSAYTDADSVSVWAVDAMVWAVENGLISGMTETTLAPAGTTNRAQVATVLMRCCAMIG